MLKKDKKKKMGRRGRALTKEKPNFFNESNERTNEKEGGRKGGLSTKEKKASIN